VQPADATPADRKQNSRIAIVRGNAVFLLPAGVDALRADEGPYLPEIPAPLGPSHTLRAPSPGGRGSEAGELRFLRVWPLATCAKL
jgi:hypothetical protein